MPCFKKQKKHWRKAGDKRPSPRTQGATASSPTADTARLHTLLNLSICWHQPHSCLLLKAALRPAGSMCAKAPRLEHDRSNPCWPGNGAKHGCAHRVVFRLVNGWHLSLPASGSRWPACSGMAARKGCGLTPGVSTVSWRQLKKYQKLRSKWKDPG